MKELLLEEELINNDSLARKVSTLQQVQTDEKIQNEIISNTLKYRNNELEISLRVNRNMRIECEYIIGTIGM